MKIPTKHLFTVVSALLIYALASTASAQDDLENFYVGGGLSNNMVSGESDSVGWQLQGGYDFGTILGDANVLAEVGYMDTGSFNGGGASGLWANGVASLPLTGHWSLLGRVGLDFGDDDGLMVGIGGSYRGMPDLETRVELVSRDNVDSLQFNLLYRF